MNTYKISKAPNLKRIKKLDRIIFPVDDPIKNNKRVLGWEATNETGKIVGFSTMYPVTGEKGVVFMARSGVLSAHQGHKLQRRLLRARCSYAKKHGFDTALTYTYYKNYSSIVNLLKTGFQFYTPAHSWAGRQFLYFWKELK